MLADGDGEAHVHLRQTANAMGVEAAVGPHSPGPAVAHPPHRFPQSGRRRGRCWRGPQQPGHQHVAGSGGNPAAGDSPACGIAVVAGALLGQRSRRSSIKVDGAVRRWVRPQPPRPGPAAPGSPGPVGHGPTGNCAGRCPGWRAPLPPRMRAVPPVRTIGVVNTVAASQRRRNQGHHLVARVPGPAHCPGRGTAGLGAGRGAGRGWPEGFHQAVIVLMRSGWLRGSIYLLVHYPRCAGAPVLRTLTRRPSFGGFGLSGLNPRVGAWGSGRGSVSGLACPVLRSVRRVNIARRSPASRSTSPSTTVLATQQPERGKSYQGRITHTGDGRDTRIARAARGLQCPSLRFGDADTGRMADASVDVGPKTYCTANSSLGRRTVNCQAPCCPAGRFERPRPPTLAWSLSPACSGYRTWRFGLSAADFPWPQRSSHRTVPPRTA